MSPHHRLQVWLSVLFFGLLTTARSELVLNNFSLSKPIKIMPIGDSITDDCSLNGAWRLYLQPMLDTNGFPFNFVGRQTRHAKLLTSGTGNVTRALCGAYAAATSRPVAA